MTNSLFPDAVFRVSVVAAGDGYVGFGTESLAWTEDSYLPIRQLASVGPLKTAEEVEAALTPLARVHGYGEGQTIVTRD